MKKLFYWPSITSYIKLPVLIILNAIYCAVYMYLYLLLIIISAEILDGIASDTTKVILLKIVLMLPRIILLVAACFLIDHILLWAITLPIQFPLYLVVFYINCFGDHYALAGDVKIIAGLLFVQAIGALINSLIRLIIRKIRSRKQPVPTE